MCPSGRSSALPQQADLRSDLRPAFEVLDADHDGKISRDDLRSFYGVLSETAIAPAADDDAAIGAMITVADSNEDGFVEYEEFRRVLDGGRRRGGSGGVMKDVFRVMDKDGDGRLSHEDLRNYMAWAGLPASDDEITAMIRLGGGDETEGVSYEGFLKILAVDDFF